MICSGGSTDNDRLGDGKVILLGFCHCCLLRNYFFVVANIGDPGPSSFAFAFANIAFSCKFGVSDLINRY